MLPGWDSSLRETRATAAPFLEGSVSWRESNPAPLWGPQAHPRPLPCWDLSCDASHSSGAGAVSSSQTPAKLGGRLEQLGCSHASLDWRSGKTLPGRAIGRGIDAQGRCGLSVTRKVQGEVGVLIRGDLGMVIPGCHPAFCYVSGAVGRLNLPQRLCVWAATQAGAGPMLLLGLKPEHPSYRVLLHCSGSD